MRKLGLREAKFRTCSHRAERWCWDRSSGLATVIVLILGKRQGFCSALQDNQLCGPYPFALDLKDLKGESDRVLGIWTTEQETENEGWNQGNVDQLGQKGWSVAALRVLAEDGSSIQGAATGTRIISYFCSSVHDSDSTEKLCGGLHQAQVPSLSWGGRGILNDPCIIQLANFPKETRMPFLRQRRRVGVGLAARKAETHTTPGVGGEPDSPRPSGYGLSHFFFFFVL